MVGYVAASGQFTVTALVLFLILFFWQVPHFLAIAWRYRDDYRRGGMAMLPSVASDGAVSLQMVVYCAGLVITTLLPFTMGMSKDLYLGMAICANAMFFLPTAYAAWVRTAVAMRVVFLTLHRSISRCCSVRWCSIGCNRCRHERGPDARRCRLTDTGERQALAGVDVAVPSGSIHAFLGPNGSGKSTLFKLMATLLPAQQGRIELLGLDVVTQAAALRRRIGVVFQSPARSIASSRCATISAYGGRLFGLAGGDLDRRVDQALERSGLADRAADAVETLSGGLQRRVELAKVTLHEPELLLLDEPSTGLDPSARQELWRFLRGIPDLDRDVHDPPHGTRPLRADQVTILHEGRVVGSGTPEALMAEVGDEMIEIECDDPAAVRARIGDRDGLEVLEVERGVRLQGPGAHRAAPQLMGDLGDAVRKLTLGRPDLEDVFIRKTGHRFAVSAEPAGAAKGRRRRR